jgi:hypothetical protein
MTAQTPESGEVVTTGKAVAPSDYDKFVHYLKERASLEGPLAIQQLTEDQTMRIFAARTEEELESAMEMLGLVGLRELDNGTLIQIDEFHLMPGSREEFDTGLGVFAVIEATLLSETKRFGKQGVKVVLDTGIPRIITWLRAVESGQIKGMQFPIQRLVIKVAAAGGKEMITLKRLPAPVKGETVKP